MQLKKILEEIKEILEDNKVSELNSDGTIDKCVIDAKLAWDYIKDIIRKHMNDGWIPVEERLPTMEEYQKDDGRFILDDGNRRCAGYYDVYTGRFYSYRHITPYRAELYEDNRIIAWRPLPGRYRPERSET